MKGSGKAMGRISLVFFVLFVLGLALYSFILRNQNADRAMEALRELSTAYLGLDQEPDQNFTSRLESTDGLLAFMVFDAGEIRYFWGSLSQASEKDEQIQLPADGLWRISPKFQASQTDLVHALFQLMGRQEFFQISRLGLILLLAYSGILLLWYILILLGKRKTENLGESRGAAQGDTGESIPPPSSPVLVQGYSQTDQIQTAPLQTASEAASQSVNETVSHTTAPSASEAASQRAAQEHEGTELLSPKTLLDERLAGELHRAGANQSDLSLALLSVDSNFPENNFLAILREKFIYKDILFLEKPRMVWVLLPQTDLDTAIREFEKLISLTKKKYAMGKLRALPRFKAGVSSRNGRILGAERLIKEAKSAHKKTGADSAIVGFRSDPEKYRSFILQRS